MSWHPLRKAFTLQYGLETVIVFLTFGGLAAVMHQFIVGKHYIIPTALLAMTLFLANVARFGYRDRRWAKHTAFWIGVLLTAHWFFAIFYAQTPKALVQSLGVPWEPVAIVIMLFVGWLSWQYHRRNGLAT